MAIPEMKLPEVLEYLNGRTVATMFVCASVAATRNLTPQQLLALYKMECEREATVAGTTAIDKAYAAGFASLVSYFEQALKTVSDADLLASLNSRLEH